MNHKGSKIAVGHEGYVVKSGSTTVKLVDREEFSYYNFHPDTERGWSS